MLRVRKQHVLCSFESTLDDKAGDIAYRTGPSMSGMAPTATHRLLSATQQYSKKNPPNQYTQNTTSAHSAFRITTTKPQQSAAMPRIPQNITRDINPENYRTRDVRSGYSLRASTLARRPTPIPFTPEPEAADEPPIDPILESWNSGWTYLTRTANPSMQYNEDAFGAIIRVHETSGAVYMNPGPELLARVWRHASLGEFFILPANFHPAPELGLQFGLRDYTESERAMSEGRSSELVPSLTGEEQQQQEQEDEEGFGSSPEVVPAWTVEEAEALMEGYVAPEEQTFSALTEEQPSSALTEEPASEAAEEPSSDLAEEDQ